MPHPHISEFGGIQIHEIVEKLHLRHEHVDGLQGLAKFKRERNTVPEVAVLVPDVELKFCPSPIMERERPIIGRRMNAEDLAPAALLHQINDDLKKIEASSVG